MIKQKGYTIVELLVVILVIAILAAVSVIAYAGIQDRARNVQTISQVNGWEKALKLYTVDHDGYPKGNADYVCLGDSFPAAAPYSENQCMVTAMWGVSVDMNFVQTIKDDVNVSMPDSDLPSLSFVDNDGGEQHYRGLLYLSRNHGAGITYLLKGDSHQCTDGDGFFEVGGYVACRRVLSGDPYQGL